MRSTRAERKEREDGARKVSGRAGRPGVPRRGLTLATWHRTLRGHAETSGGSDNELQLARDLHDAVASQVSIIGIHAAAGRRVLADQPSRAAEALESIEAAARTANADLRRMLAALRAEVDPKHPASPGLARLPDLVAEFRAAGLTVDVVGLDAIPALSQGLDTAAYRIIQEAWPTCSRMPAPSGHRSPF